MRVLIFDMDGVLVDSTASFRQALIDTVEHFTGQPVDPADVVEWKNRGGFNDDSLLADRMIAARGFDVSFDRMLDHYIRIFWGTDADGMVRHEHWMVADGLLERLGESHRLSIFTGRPAQAARHTLGRFAAHLPFDPVMTSDQVKNTKPAPDGLLAILDAVGPCEPLFIGDNVDDARSARAASVPFIGVVDAGAPHREASETLLRAEGAVAVISSVNEIENVLAGALS